MSRVATVALAVLAMLAVVPGPPARASEPPLDLTWVDPPPALQGRVERTLPYLTRLAARYRGLVVVGAYHPKPRPLPAAEVTDALVREAAAAIGLSGAVLARDPRWRTLSRWWLEGRERPFTSVSFLVDGQGRIAWVHAGGEYHPAAAGERDHDACARSAAALESTLARLLGPARTP